MLLVHSSTFDYPKLVFKEIICVTNRIFMVFSLVFGGLILACNGSLTLNLLCTSDCYVVPEGTWRSRGRGTGDFIVTNPHYLVSIHVLLHYFQAAIHSCFLWRTRLFQHLVISYCSGNFASVRFLIAHLYA